MRQDVSGRAHSLWLGCCPVRSKKSSHAAGSSVLSPASTACHARSERWQRAPAAVCVNPAASRAARMSLGNGLFMPHARSTGATIRCRPCRRGAHQLSLAQPTGGGGAGFRTRPREGHAGAIPAHYFRGTDKRLPTVAYGGLRGQPGSKTSEWASGLFALSCPFVGGCGASMDSSIRTEYAVSRGINKKCGSIKNATTGACERAYQ